MQMTVEVATNTGVTTTARPKALIRLELIRLLSNGAAEVDLEEQAGGTTAGDTRADSGPATTALPEKLNKPDDGSSTNGRVNADVCRAEMVNSSTQELPGADLRCV